MEAKDEIASGQIDDLSEVSPPPRIARLGWQDLVLALAVIWSVDTAIGLAMMLAGGAELPNLPPTFLLAGTLLSNAATVSICCYFVCYRHGLSLREGFALFPVKAKVVAGCVVLGMVCGLGGGFIVSNFSGKPSLIADWFSTPGGRVAISLLALIVPPFEEMYYRGFIFPILRNGLGAVWAVPIVSIWFTSIHAIQLWGDWLGLGVLLVMGTVWTLQRHWTDSLWPSIVTHFSYNAILVAVSFLAAGS